MKKNYFGFAVADSMFPAECSIRKTSASAAVVGRLAEEGHLGICLNPSHAATISAMENRFGIRVPIPEKPPQVSLKAGDSLYVMGVRGLPRLTDRHEYSTEEIGNATFSFSRYEVLE